MNRRLIALLLCFLAGLSCSRTTPVGETRSAPQNKEKKTDEDARRPQPSIASSAQPKPALKSEAITGLWRWRVTSFETTDSYVHKPKNPISPEIVLKPTAAHHKVAVVKLWCKPTREYTAEEKLSLNSTSVGKAGLGFASVFDADKILATSCFLIGHPGAPSQSGQAINLSRCGLLIAEKGSVNGIEVPNEKKGEPSIYVVFIKDAEVEATLVFPHTPMVRNPILFFQPALGSTEIGAAQVTLNEKGMLSDVWYGSLADVRKWLPDGTFPSSR